MCSFSLRFGEQPFFKLSTEISRETTRYRQVTMWGTFTVPQTNKDIQIKQRISLFFHPWSELVWFTEPSITSLKNFLCNILNLNRSKTYYQSDFLSLCCIAAPGCWKCPIWLCKNVNKKTDLNTSNKTFNKVKLLFC